MTTSKVSLSGLFGLRIWLVLSLSLAGLLVTPPAVAADRVAPSVPANLVAYTATENAIGVIWDPSTDNVGVAGYRLLRDGVPVTETIDITHLDFPLTAGTSYTYTVVAFDAAGNASAPSAPLTAQTQPPAPLGFLTPERLPDAVVGQPYLAYIVANGPATANTYRLRLVSGKVPPGTSFLENTLPSRLDARVLGTPKKAGTFVFTVEVTIASGATARRTFTIVVLPAL